MTPEEHALALAAHARLLLGEQPWLWDRIAAAVRAAVLEERQACLALARQHAAPDCPACREIVTALRARA